MSENVSKIDQLNIMKITKKGHKKKKKKKSDNMVMKDTKNLLEDEKQKLV